MWHPREASYEAFAEHLAAAGDFPTYLPWPIGTGWRVTDVARVGGRRGTTATLSAVAGSTLADGPIEVVVVSEEPGTGLGARVAGARHSDPGHQIASAGEAATWLRVEHADRAMWPVDVDPARGEHGEVVEQSVVVGEVHGRWLWLVLRPASALLLLAEGWALADASAHGPELVELDFGGPPPPWRRHG